MFLKAEQSLLRVLRKELLLAGERVTANGCSVTLL